MIQEMVNTNENIAYAENYPEPRHVWIDGKRIILYTGDDIPVE